MNTQPLSEKDIEQLLYHTSPSKRNAGMYALYLHPKIRTYIFAYVQQNGGTLEDAKDILQQAIIIFYEKLNDGKFKFVGSILAYINGIGKNQWRKHLRSTKEEFSLEEGFSQADSADFLDHQNPEQDLIAKEEADHLQTINHHITAATKSLGPTCRQYIIHWHKKTSYAEMTRIMGLSNEATARNGMSKCRKKLRKLLMNDPIITHFVKNWTL